jgi:hypothetical protein
MLVSSLDWLSKWFLDSYWYDCDSNYWSAVYKHTYGEDFKFKAGYDSDVRLGWASLWVCVSFHNFVFHNNIIDAIHKYSCQFCIPNWSHALQFTIVCWLWAPIFWIIIVATIIDILQLGFYSFRPNTILRPAYKRLCIVKNHGQLISAYSDELIANSL